MMIIRSDVPIPPLRNRFRIRLEAMEIGDSFAYEGTYKEIASLRNSVTQAAKSLNRKFTVRADPFSGVICWRTA